MILAAGIGSRYGGVKQLEPVGPNGELIIDYSIHDAISAGFNRIVFVIRKELDADFHEVIGDRIESICESLEVEVKYVFQSLTNVPISVPDGRTKPWGTGQAVLSCEGLLTEPFAVINADDYNGKDSFLKAHSFLSTGLYGLVGFKLVNTLSDFGGVTRGICTVKNGKLIRISETHNIVNTPQGVKADGRSLLQDSIVSMNFWCFPKSFVAVLKEQFPHFLSSMSNPRKDEFLLPTIVDGLLKKGTEVSVLQTSADWFGLTYQEDRASVVAGFQKLYEKGIYNEESLYSDICR